MELWNNPIDTGNLFLDFFWGVAGRVVGFFRGTIFLKRYEWPKASYPKLTFKYFQRGGLFVDNLGVAW
jgi:hypothetical protein